VDLTGGKTEIACDYESWTYVACGDVQQLALVLAASATGKLINLIYQMK
jgi:hypothetical protein